MRVIGLVWTMATVAVAADFDEERSGEFLTQYESRFGVPDLAVAMTGMVTAVVRFLAPGIFEKEVTKAEADQAG